MLCRFARLTLAFRPLIRSLNQYPNANDTQEEEDQDQAHWHEEYQQALASVELARNGTDRLSLATALLKQATLLKDNGRYEEADTVYESE